MNLFQLNLVLYGDHPGLGAYEVGHFLQHQQYLHILAAQGVQLPDYNIIRMGPGPAGWPGQFLGDNPNEFLTWLNTHEILHSALRAQANATGLSLASLDPDSPDAWEQWQEEHRRQHASFDIHFRTT